MEIADYWFWILKIQPSIKGCCNCVKRYHKIIKNANDAKMSLKAPSNYAQR